MVGGDPRQGPTRAQGSRRPSGQAAPAHLRVGLRDFQASLLLGNAVKIGQQSAKYIANMYINLCETET